MKDRIAEYAMIGDLRTGALVHRDGSIDWACVPHFAGDAVFAALLGDESNGVWRLAPSESDTTSERRYRNGTLILETLHTRGADRAVVTDFMSVGSASPAIVRIVRGLSGSVDFTTSIAPRFRYGRLAPRGERISDGWIARAAPDALCLRATVALMERGSAWHADFTVTAGETVAFVVQAFPSVAAVPPALDWASALSDASAWWNRWSGACRYDGPYREAVVRSAVALKALSSIEHGSFVAALTTSLPEILGGAKNWDYRFTWLRDASFAVQSLLRLGFVDEAAGWLDWFGRVCLGRPDALHIMYGADGRTLESEREIPWLAGFADSSPVRVLNAAHTQFQLGVYGDVVMAFHDAQRAGVALDQTHWLDVESIVTWLADCWQRAGNGIWERRDGRRQYVDSKLMVWVAFERAIAIARRGGFATDLERWQRCADDVKDEICRAGYDPMRSTFTQAYGSADLDASVLMIPLVGMLAADDPRVLGTVAAIERHLREDGFVYRYTADDIESGGSPTEGAFAMCAFWLVQVYVKLGRRDEAVALFERLLATANDVGLMSEEFDTSRNIAIGNFPQAFSHSGLIDAACALAATASER